MYESRNMTYLLEDVMSGRFERGFYAEDLWHHVQAHNTPIVTYTMRDVEHWIYYPCWSKQCDNDEYFLSIYQILMQKERFPGHHARIRDANTEYPLIVIEDAYDRHGSILDGNHRFAKLFMENAQTVRVYYLSIQEIAYLYR